MAFKHAIDLELKQRAEFYIISEYKNLDITDFKLICPLSTCCGKKKVAGPMKSYMPLYVVINTFEDPSQSNKELTISVHRYVRRLTI